MPSFTNSLIGLGPFVDMGNTVVFTATGVSVVHPDGHSILDGWREAAGARLWHFPLKPTQDTPAEVHETPSVAFVLPDDHVDKDSTLWRKVTTKKGNSGAVIPVQEGTQEGSSEEPAPTLPTKPKPSVRRPCKRKPARRRPTMPPASETVAPPLPAATPPPPAATPPTPKSSDQQFEAVDE